MKKMKTKTCNFIADIRFWIFFSFFLRLVGITNAPLEIGHNWRQSLTNMIARNFYETSPNLLYPKIDMGGNLTGIIGSEFPFYNFLIYMCSEIFGYSHWYGRLINLIVSSLGIYCFYLIIKKICSERISFYGTIFLLFSIWFGFSRKIMPDTFSIAIVFIAIYYGLRFLNEGKYHNLIIYFILLTLGMLCKIPALSIVSGIFLLIFNKNLIFKNSMLIILTSVISLIIVFSWYFYWVPYLVKNYQFPLYFPKKLGEGFEEIRPLWKEFLEKFYFASFSSYTAFLLFVFGVVIFIKKGEMKVKYVVCCISLVFVLFILKTGAVFPTHSYYIIPFVPIMAFLIGYGFSIIPAKWGNILTFLFIVESIGNQQHDFFIKKEERYKLKLENFLQDKIKKTDLIVINGGDSPQTIYFSHRKGWTLQSERFTLKVLDSLKEQGAKHVVIDNHNYPPNLSALTKSYHSIDFDVYSFNKD